MVWRLRKLIRQCRFGCHEMDGASTVNSPKNTFLVFFWVNLATVHAGGSDWQILASLLVKPAAAAARYHLQKKF
jgi:hypothetical protein